MAQNPYLQNLLGINQSGMGLYNYNYDLPTYNNLLSQGLTESQIEGYDPRFNTFDQFPFKAKPNPQQDFAQYEVVPQVAGQVPVQEEEETEVDIDYGNSNTNNNNSFEDITTQRYGTIRDNNPEALNLSNVPLNDMSESELMDYGMRKGYIGTDGILLGPQQAQTGKMGLMGMALSGPAQMMNDKKYEMFTKALQKKKMFLGSYGGDREDRGSFASFSPSYDKALGQAEYFNNTMYNPGSTGQVRIPGTAKSVNAIFSQYVPSGKDDNELIYKTGSGGHYREDGKFESAYGQVQRFGSMTDAIDVIKAAAQSGNYASIPSKFDQAWVNKIINSKANITPEQKNIIESSWNTIKSGKSKVKVKPAISTKKKSVSTPNDYNRDDYERDIMKQALDKMIDKRNTSQYSNRGGGSPNYVAPKKSSKPAFLR